MPSTRILIFSHFSDRDGTALLRCIAESLQSSNLDIQYVIISTYDEKRNGETRIGVCSYDKVTIEYKLISYKDRNLKNRFLPETQKLYAEFWKEINPQATV